MHKLGHIAIVTLHYDVKVRYHKICYATRILNRTKNRPFWLIQGLDQPNSHTLVIMNSLQNLRNQINLFSVTLIDQLITYIQKSYIRSGNFGP